MNAYTSFLHITKKNLSTVLSVTSLAAITLIALFAFEIAPVTRFASQEALAWDCESMTADKTTIVRGGSTSLAWAFTADDNVWVSVDGVTGTWNGVTGSTVVSPTKTTTYTAIAHQTGSEVTYRCNVTIEVTEPPVQEEPSIPACPYTASANVTVVDFNAGKTHSPSTTLRSDGGGLKEMVKAQSLSAGTYTVKTASWDGYLARVNISQPKEQWNVEVRTDAWKKGPVGPTTDLADNVVQSTKNDTFTNALVLTETGARVAVVHASNDTSSANSVTPICVAFEKKDEPKPPVEKEPIVPACPYTASANVTVVDFNGGKARTDATLLRSDGAGLKEIVKAQSLSAGTYTVKTASWDGYLARVNTSQPKEQWNVEVRTDAWKKGPVGPTTDIADNIIQNSKNDTFTNALVLTETGARVAVVHASNDTTSPNSVVPVCVAFEKKSESVDPTPSCSMNVSASRVKKGESVTLNWSSSNTTSATIDQGIGATTLSGSKSVVVKSPITFTGIFKDSKGKEVTCTANVSIRTSGGGGKCINCGDDDDEDEEEDDDDPKPTIVLGKTITKAGSFITLDQVPYTGFEAGPALTMFFWIMVFMASVLIAYVVTRYSPLDRFRTALATAQGYRNSADDSHVYNNEVQATPVINESVMAPVQNQINLSDIAHALDSTSEAISLIEEIAHKENILLSPEALRLMYSEIRKIDSSPTQYLIGLFEIAKTEYPQEDGWILLSKERAEKLLSKSQNNTVLDVSADDVLTPVEQADNALQSDKPHRVEPKQLSGNRETPTTTSSAPQTHTSVREHSQIKPDDASALLFIDSLVNLEKKKVFDMLRTFASRGNDVGILISSVVRKLDEVYRYRLEGGRTPDKEIAGKTATWSNGDFENVLGILVECVDYSYSNNHIGTKVALTKAFEHFEKKA